MPECLVAERVREQGAGDRAVRLFLTFTAAMDRARDADRLWFAAEKLFRAAPWCFVPEQVAMGDITALADLLRRHAVSQRHGPDAFAWRILGESLHAPERAPAMRRAVVEGIGDAHELLSALRATSEAGTDLFPLLRGPKVGPMWIRMLAYPGGAAISSLEALPVAVDAQVRKVTEYLGATDTGSLSLDEARPEIQAVWKGGCRRARSPGARAAGRYRRGARSGAVVLGKVGVYAMRVGPAQSARRKRL